MTEPDRPRAEVNLYAPPEAAIGEAPAEAPGDFDEVQAVRRRYLSHETTVKSIGTLHFLAAFFCPLVLIMSVVTTPVGGAFSDRMGPSVGALSFLLVTALQVVLGLGLSRFKPWARWVETTLLGLTFVGGFGVVSWMAAVTRGAIFPVIVAYGVLCLIPGYVLYLLLSREGTVVFSREYRDVIARTPHIKYRTSCLAWFVFGLVIAAALAFVVGAYVNPRF